MPRRDEKILDYFELAMDAYPEPEDGVTIHIVARLLSLGYDVSMPSPRNPVALAATKGHQVWAAKAETRYAAVVALCESMADVVE